MMSSAFELQRLLSPNEPRTPPRAQVDEVPMVDSASLLRGHAELRIEHHGAVYRLKQTSLGKLILTK